MTALWTSDDVAAATDGRAPGDWNADGICFDSRSVSIGDLFVAVKGPKFDGHNFVAEALERGASAAIVSRIPVDGEQTVNENRLVIVKDTMVALQSLARAARYRMSGRIAAVTGSVGKTTTKEALTLAMSRQGLAHATLGNLNNHWGVPLSLARMPAATEYAILELGMNHAGEINPLSRMVRPHVAVITTVEAVHLKFFASVSEIANEKAEIFLGLEPGGVAIIPADNPHFNRIALAAKNAGSASIVSFGTDQGAAYRLVAWDVSNAGTRIAADVNGKRLFYDIGMTGKHMALNSLAVLAAVDALGGDVEQAAGDLNDMMPPTGRGARSMISLHHGTFSLIDESYNASPASIAALAEALNATRKKGRVILALGDMLELGDHSDELHADLATPITCDGIDCVFTAGPGMRNLHDALPIEKATGHAENSEELVALIARFIEPGDIIAVKGSFGSRMSVVVNTLKNLGQQTQTAVNSG